MLAGVWFLVAGTWWLDGGAFNGGPCETDRGRALLVLAGFLWPLWLVAAILAALYFLARDIVLGGRFKDIP